MTLWKYRMPVMIITFALLTGIPILFAPLGPGG